MLVITVNVAASVWPKPFFNVFLHLEIPSVYTYSLLL